MWHIQKKGAFTYSLSDLNPVMSEALLEHNSQIFRSVGALNGFLGVKVVVTQPFKDKGEKREFVETIQSLKGAKNTSSLVVFEATQQTDDLSKQINIQDLTSKYNDKLFEYSDTRSEKNISKAFTVPLILVSSSDKSVFGDSGALLKEAKIQLWESRKEVRNQFEEVFGYIMARFSEPVNDLKIINPYEEVTDEVTEDVNAKAQATLRGSVGGVTSLLLIQQGVSAGTTTKEAGVAMIVNLYGFSEEQAEAMLGNPKLKEDLE
jgi:hypothetical protein